MADQPDKTAQQKADELEKRVAELERMWSQLKWAAAILGTAVLIVAGIGFVQIPRAASDEAVRKVTPIAEKAAEESAKEVVRVRVPEAVTDELEKQKARALVATEDAEKAASRAGSAANDAEAKLKAITNAIVDRLQIRRIDVIDADGGTRATIAASPQQGIVVSGGGIDVQAGDVRTSGRFVVYHPAQGDLIWMQNYADTGGRIIVRDPVAKRERIELRGDHTGAFLNLIDNGNDRNTGVLQRQVDGTVTIYMFKLKDIPK